MGKNVILGICAEGVRVSLRDSQQDVICETPEALNRAIAEHGLDEEDAVVMCSSSMDFPAEHTAKQWAIDWARAMRGGE